MEVTLTLCQHHAYQRRGTVVDHPRHFSSGWVSKLTLIGYFNELIRYFKVNKQLNMYFHQKMCYIKSLTRRQSNQQTEGDIEDLYSLFNSQENFGASVRHQLVIRDHEVTNSPDLVESRVALRTNNTKSGIFLLFYLHSYSA